MAENAMSMYPDSVLNEVNHQIDAKRLLQLLDFKMEKLQESGETIRGFCPIHNETVFRTLLIHKGQRTFRCMYGLCEGSEGGNLIRLYSLIKKVSMEDAVNDLMREFQIKVEVAIDPQFVERNLDAAEQALEAGLLDEALKGFRTVAEMQPDTIRAHEGLLQVCQSMGDAEGQIAAHEKLANLYFAHNDGVRAAEHARELTQLQPDATGAHRLLGTCLMSLGEEEQAVDELMAAADLAEMANDFVAAVDCYTKIDEIGLEVIDVVPHLMRAFGELGQGDKAVDYLVMKAERAAQQSEFSRAAELYVEALNIDSLRMDLRGRFVEIAALADAGAGFAERIAESLDLMVLHNEFPRAARCLEMLLEQNPADSAAIDRLASLYQQMGHEEQVVGLRLRKARADQEAGRHAEALQAVRDLEARMPENADVLELAADFEKRFGDPLNARHLRVRLAQIMMDRGDFRRALAVTNDVVAETPQAVDALHLRAQIMETWGKTDEPDMIPAAATAYEALGDLLMDETSARRAAEFFEKAISLGSPRPDLHLRLARCYNRIGSRTEARDLVVMATDALAAQGEGARALQEISHFSSLMPEDTVLIQHQAEMKAKQGDPEGAARALLGMAETQMLLGNNAQARQTLERALGLAPGNLALITRLVELLRQENDAAALAGMLVRMAEILQRQQQFAQALDALNEASVLRQDAKTLEMMVSLASQLGQAENAHSLRLRLADEYRDKGDLDGETRVLDEIAVATPMDQSVLGRLMECHFRRGNDIAGCEAARRLATAQQLAGQDAESRATLTYALQHSPNDIPTLTMHFEALCGSGDRQQAVTEGLHLADLLADKNSTEDAVAVFSRLVLCDPHNLGLKLRQAEFLRKVGRAQESLEKLLKLAASYRILGNFDEAEQVLQEALLADPADTRVLEQFVGLFRETGNIERLVTYEWKLADALYTSGNIERALASMRYIVEKQPSNIDARQQLIGWFRDTNRIREAVRELRSLANEYRQLGIDDGAVDAETEADLLVAGESQERPAAATETPVPEVPTEISPLERQAHTYLIQKDYEAALRSLDELVAAEPSNHNARRMRADVYLKMGNESLALEEYRAIAEVVRNPVASVQQVVAVPDIAALQIVKEYDFDHFVVGSHNNFAYATSLAVARAPAKAYNPLFIYSDVGLGKTHLANAIANHVLGVDPNARIIYTNSEDFTGELVAAIQTNEINSFRGKYKSVDLLIVDDVQFLAGKERAQEEFFHIFNALFQSKRQIVVTSDRPPKDIARLEARLLSRFGAGVIVDIASPDVETRLAILNREIEQQKLNIDHTIAGIIAERVDSNVRELKGALNQVVVMRDLRGKEVTEENVIDLLNTLYVRT